MTKNHILIFSPAGFIGRHLWSVSPVSVLSVAGLDSDRGSWTSASSRMHDSSSWERRKGNMVSWLDDSRRLRLRSPWKRRRKSDVEELNLRRFHQSVLDSSLFWQSQLAGIVFFPSKHKYSQLCHPEFASVSIFKCGVDEEEQQLEANTLPHTCAAVCQRRWGCGAEEPSISF